MTTDEAIGLALDELAARVTAVEADLVDLRLAGAQPTRAATEAGPVPGPLYPTLHDWVGEYFLPTFIRPLGGEYRWCAQWSDHAEALGRLESLWRAWEVLRLDPGLGMAAWFTQHLDPQLPVLLGRSGPFAQCSQNRHSLPGLDDGGIAWEACSASRDQVGRDLKSHRTRSVGSLSRDSN